MKLHELKPADGATKRPHRVGRGLGSGWGTYAGRGKKGQHARTGGVKPPYFEGGNLPLVRKLPFARGVGNAWRPKTFYVPINLAELTMFEAGDIVSPESLVASGLLKAATDPVVVLGHGDIDRALTIKAHRVSESARRKIEAAGGTVEIIKG
jgi:large subunit ribosomal protein L15